MKVVNKLSRAIKRSEKAYSLYLEDNMFFKALRIYKSNLVIYGLLEEYAFECDEAYLDEVFNFIFHLEDWFESFHSAQSNNPALNDSFVFERLKNSPAFPSDFVKNITK